MFIQKHVDNKQTGSITLELVYELLIFISQVITDDAFIDYQVTKDIIDMFHIIKDLIKACEEISECKIDLKSHMFKKKVQPLISNI